MTTIACKTLQERLDEKCARGLVDIKFYIHDANRARPDQVCEEAERLLEAIADGQYEPFNFGDRHNVAV